MGDRGREREVLAVSARPLASDTEGVWVGGVLGGAGRVNNKNTVCVDYIKLYFKLCFHRTHPTIASQTVYSSVYALVHREIPLVLQ